MFKPFQYYRSYFQDVQLYGRNRAFPGETMDFRRGTAVLDLAP
jgi:hypothetical protein